MKTLERSAAAVILALGLTLGPGSMLRASTASDWYQEYPAPYTDLRGLVDRTQADLRGAEELEHGNSGQRARYQKAQGHLSSFDRRLTRGKFDRSELDKAIGSIKGILDHNILQASSRDALLRDDSDLRVARARRY